MEDDIEETPSAVGEPPGGAGVPDALGDPWRVPERREGAGRWKKDRWHLRAGAVAFALAAAAGFGATQGAQWWHRATAVQVDLDDRSLTVPDHAALKARTGAAWSETPTIDVTVHVVNDGTTDVRLTGGTLTGPLLTGGTLRPDGTGDLAPGRSGSLTGPVTVDCTAQGKLLSDSTSLVASIDTSGPMGTSAVRDLQIGGDIAAAWAIKDLCVALPPPISVNETASATATATGLTCRFTVRNITDRPFKMTGVGGSDQFWTITGVIPSATLLGGRSETVTVAADRSSPTDASTETTPMVIIQAVDPTTGHGWMVGNQCR